MGARGNLSHAFTVHAGFVRIRHIRKVHPPLLLPLRGASSYLALAFNPNLTLTESLRIHDYRQILVLLIISGEEKK